MKYIFPVFGLIAIFTSATWSASIKTVDEERLDNFEERGPYFEGDIILNTINSGIINESYRWPNNTLIYTLDSTFTLEERGQLLAGIEEITNKTCIRFKTWTDEIDYVFVQRGGAGTGCYSYVGRVGGRQELNFQVPGCLRHGTISHEFIHALGFYHEQSRTDRDDYVIINWDNIQPGKEGNFNKYGAERIDPFNVTYDYGSVMHYSGYGFAIDPEVPTIIPRDPDAVIGQRVEVSRADALKLNRMYNCLENPR